MSLPIKTGRTIEPIRTVLVGQEGVGKTTFVVACPKVLFLTAALENGGGDLEYDRIVIETWAELISTLNQLVLDSQGYEALALDSMSAFEKLAGEAVKLQANAESLDDIEFGKGAKKSADKMCSLLVLLDKIRARQRMHIFLLAHAHIRPFADPLGATFDRYELRMEKGTAPLVTAWADMQLFACFDSTVRKGRKEAGAMEKGKLTAEKRMLYTTKDVGFDAKNRYNLPDELPLDWKAFSKAMRWTERTNALRPTKEDNTAALAELRAVLAARVKEIFGEASEVTADNLTAAEGAFTNADLGPWTGWGVARLVAAATKIKGLPAGELKAKVEAFFSAAPF